MYSCAEGGVRSVALTRFAFAPCWLAASAIALYMARQQYCGEQHGTKYQASSICGMYSTHAIFASARRVGDLVGSVQKGRLPPR